MNQLDVLQAERSLHQGQMKTPLDELFQPANRYQPVPATCAFLHRLFLLIFREPGDLQGVLQVDFTFPKRFLGRLDQLIKLQPELHIGGLFSHLAGENFQILVGPGQRQVPFGLFQGMHVFPLNILDQDDLACIVVGKIPDGGGNFLETCYHGRLPAPIATNHCVSFRWIVSSHHDARPPWPQDQILQDTVRPDGSDQVLHLLLVELPALIQTRLPQQLDFNIVLPA